MTANKLKMGPSLGKDQDLAPANLPIQPSKNTHPEYIKNVTTLSIDDKKPLGLETPEISPLKECIILANRAAELISELCKQPKSDWIFNYVDSSSWYYAEDEVSETVNLEGHWDFDIVVPRKIAKMIFDQDSDFLNEIAGPLISQFFDKMRDLSESNGGVQQ